MHGLQDLRKSPHLGRLPAGQQAGTARGLLAAKATPCRASTCGPARNTPRLYAAPLYTDNQFHNNGLDLDPPDPGLAARTEGRLDRGKFKTPTLRNIEYTAPYMHDGRFQTLEEVIEHYDSGFHRTRLTDPLLLIRPSLDLSATEQSALLTFLKTLSDPQFQPR